LFRYGRATKTTETQSLAHREHDQQLRLAAKSALKYPAVELTGLQARAVARGFGNYAARAKMAVWACAVLPDHVHLVIGRLKLRVENVVIQLKGDATEQLVSEGIHPQARRQEPGKRVPKCFARGEWKVYLEADDVPQAVKYVEENPLKEGKPLQQWSFVVPHHG